MGDGDGKGPGESENKIFDDSEIIKAGRRIDDFLAQKAIFVARPVRLHQAPIHAQVPPERVAGRHEARGHPHDQENRRRRRSLSTRRAIAAGEKRKR